ncbi:DNA helicase UvrD [Candidatus Kuenenbacteria bacterium]|nr:DNA helicase UvrD [Candidatus Kuenenbacteria bacterium]
MKIIADLHIHSRFSRACSRDLVLDKIDETCRTKGVNVVGTGDFTHPEWFSEMREKLAEKEKGLYTLKSQIQNPNFQSNPKSKTQEFKQARFICSAEIACIYSKGGKVRRLHVMVLAPSLEAVEKINLALGKIGNLKSDGRPILGLDVEKLAEIVFGVDEGCVVIPAHIWTPWFAMFGSKSGFDSVEECWGQMADQIFAIETGLSSDPEMNWRVKNLDRMSIISNSDAHSLPNIGREANVFEVEEDKLSFNEIMRIIKSKNPKEFLYTVEFYPEEGMYHFDGHRACRTGMTPSESKRNKNICPKCKKELTIGVLNRVEELAEEERGEGHVDKSRVPFVKLVELDKIIAEVLGVKSRNSKQVKLEYNSLIKNFGSEFDILLQVDLKKIAEKNNFDIAEGIRRVRVGELFIKPGYDGQYGEIKIFGSEKERKRQMNLFE